MPSRVPIYILYIYIVFSVLIHRGRMHVRSSLSATKKTIRSVQWRSRTTRKRWKNSRGRLPLKVREFVCFWISFICFLVLSVSVFFLAWIGGLISVGIISLSGLVGGIFWPLLNNPKKKKTVMRLLLGLATGSLSSSAVFQLLPEVSAKTEFLTKSRHN